MSNAQVQGYFGATVIVRGRLEGEGDLVVRGRVQGDAQIDGDLIVEEGGCVQGNVHARNTEILGEVIGDVAGSASVSIRAGGSVRGDLRSSCVAIDDGGTLVGGIDMDFSIESEKA